MPQNRTVLLWPPVLAVQDYWGDVIMLMSLTASCRESLGSCINRRCASQQEPCRLDSGAFRRFYSDVVPNVLAMLYVCFYKPAASNGSSNVSIPHLKEPACNGMEKRPKRGQMSGNSSNRDDKNVRVPYLWEYDAGDELLVEAPLIGRSHAQGRQ